MDAVPQWSHYMTIAAYPALPLYAFVADLAMHAFVSATDQNVIGT